MSLSLSYLPINGSIHLMEHFLASLVIPLWLIIVKSNENTSWFCFYFFFLDNKSVMLCYYIMLIFTLKYHNYVIAYIHKYHILYIKASQFNFIFLITFLIFCSVFIWNFSCSRKLMTITLFFFFSCLSVISHLVYFFFFLHIFCYSIILISLSEYYSPFLFHFTLWSIAYFTYISNFNPISIGTINGFIVFFFYFNKKKRHCSLIEGKTLSSIFLLFFF